MKCNGGRTYLDTSGYASINHTIQTMVNISKRPTVCLDMVTKKLVILLNDFVSKY